MGSGLCSQKSLKVPHQPSELHTKGHPLLQRGPHLEELQQSFCSWKLQHCYWQQKRTTSPDQCSGETWSERALCRLTIVLAALPPLLLFSSLADRFITPRPKLVNISYLFCSSPLPSFLSSCLLGCICILFAKVLTGIPFSWSFHVAFMLQQFFFHTLQWLPSEWKDHLFHIKTLGHSATTEAAKFLYL